MCIHPLLPVQTGSKQTSPPEESFVKVWIWHERQDDLDIAHNLGHTALEIHKGGNANQLIYVSFWTGNFTEAHRKQCGSKCDLKFHFHHTKKEDDSVQPDKIATEYRLYSLNLDKIIRAFQKFSAKPDAYGSLGWGLFHRPYAFNAAGVVAYLLNEGGIHRLASYKRDTFFSRIFRTIAGVGFISTIINLWSAYQVRSIGQTFEHPLLKFNVTFIPASSAEIFNRYTQYILGFANTAHACKTSNRSLVEIHKRSLNIFLNLEKHDTSDNVHQIRGEALEIAAEAEDANKALINEIKLRMGPNFFLVQSPAGAANSISDRMSLTAKISLISVGISLGLLYIQHRFLEGEITTRDIAIIVQKARKREERELI